MDNIYKKIRLKYGLSKLGMSKVLGFGVNQWRLYEDGRTEPKDSHALLIEMVKDPKSMLNLMDRHEVVLRRELGDLKYARVQDRAAEMVGEFEKLSDASYREWVEKLYK